MSKKIHLSVTMSRTAPNVETKEERKRSESSFSFLHIIESQQSHCNKKKNSITLKLAASNIQSQS